MTDAEYDALLEKMARAIAKRDFPKHHPPRSFLVGYLEIARLAADAAGLKPGVVVVPAEADGGMKFQGGLAIEDAMFQEGKLVFDAAGDCYAAMVAAARFQPANAGEAA